MPKTAAQILLEQDKKVKTLEDRLTRLEGHNFLLQKQLVALNRRNHVLLEKLSHLEITIQRLTR